MPLAARFSTAHTAPTKAATIFDFAAAKAILRGRESATTVIPASGTNETVTVDITTEGSPRKAPHSAYISLLPHERTVTDFGVSGSYLTLGSLPANPYLPVGSFSAGLLSVSPYLPVGSLPVSSLSVSPHLPAASLPVISYPSSQWMSWDIAAAGKPARMEALRAVDTLITGSSYLDKLISVHGSVGAALPAYLSVGSAVVMPLQWPEFSDDPVPLTWQFNDLLSQWALPKAQHRAFANQLKDLLSDEEELTSLGIVPSRVSFAHLAKYFASCPMLTPPVLTITRSGTFMTMWRPKPKLRMTFEFRDDGRIRWIFTDSARKGRPLTGSGTIEPEKALALAAAYDFQNWMTQ